MISPAGAETPRPAALAAIADLLREPVRVVYLMGAGRSGSTFLGAALGGHPQVTAVGELTNLVDHAWRRGYYCACGRLGQECPFWAAVRERWARLCGGEDLDGYLGLQRRFDPPARVLRTLAAARRGTPALADYAQRTALLFAAIREVAGRPVMVDASKSPARALVLGRTPGVALTLVHLVRDARGVAWSHRGTYEANLRQGLQHRVVPRPVADAAWRWVAANLASEYVARRVAGGRVRLRYEDFAAQPAAAMEPLGRAAGLDLAGVGEALASGAAFDMGHCVAGNRLRMSGPARLRLDEEWRGNLTRRQRLVVAALAGALLRFYGFTGR